jgi:hypothetical protein
LAIAATLLMTAGGAASGKSSGMNCSRDLPQGQRGLPAAVVVTTDCGKYRLGTDGSVAYTGKWKGPVPKVARGYWMDLTWYGVDHGHVLIGRGMKRLWRSHDTYPRGRYVDIGSVIIGNGRVAFSYYQDRQSRVLVARLGGAEHVVARGEVPFVFTPSGDLVSWQERGHALVLHTANGRERTLARHAVDAQVDRANEKVLFRSARQLLVFDGASVRRLLSLPTVGITGPPTVEPLGRLVAVHDRHRLVIVGNDRRLVASTVLPRSRHRVDGVSSPVAANADGSAFAYTVTSGNRARETVYLLAADTHRGRPLRSQRFVGGGCGAGAWLAWRGHWVLYSNAGQQAAVVDSSGHAPAVDLGDVIAKLPGLQDNGEGTFNVDWSA